VAGGVEGVVRPALEQWLLENGTIGRGDRRAHHPRGARPRGAARGDAAGLRKTAISHRLNLPGKLADCSSTDPARVSCSSSRATAQAAPPSRGAIAARRRSSRCAARCSTRSRRRPPRSRENKELQDIVNALGCGIGNDFDVTKLRYGGSSC
jgi:DNA gyrase/topoisomerase IV subunit B